MSNSRVVKIKTETPATIKLFKNITIVEAGWVDDTTASGFWYYDYFDNNIKDYMQCDVIFNIEYSNLSIYGSKCENGYIRLYSLSMMNDFICNIKLITGAK
jgi:hypothetical protein